MEHLEYDFFTTTWHAQAFKLNSRIQEGLIWPSWDIHLENCKSLQLIFVTLVYRRTHLLVFLYLGQSSSTAFSEVGDLPVFLGIFFQVRSMVRNISDVCLYLFSQRIFGTSTLCNCTIIDALFSFSTGKPR